MSDDLLIQKKIDLKNAWADLKGDGDDDLKREAAAAVVRLQKEIARKEPKFKPINLADTQYGVYLLDKPKEVGGWPSPAKDPYYGQIAGIYDEFVGQAVDIVRKRSPDAEISSPNLFGQMVNATTANLIQLSQSIALDTLTKMLAQQGEDEE